MQETTFVVVDLSRPEKIPPKRYDSDAPAWPKRITDSWEANVKQGDIRLSPMSDVKVANEYLSAKSNTETGFCSSYLSRF